MTERFIQVTFSNPVEGREDEFNEWYDNVHIPELLAIPGMVSATRYDLHDSDTYRMEGGLAPEHRYLTIYEMEGDVNTIMAKIVEGVASGNIVMSDSLDLQASRMSFWSARGPKVLPDDGR
ncbi:DUF4286 family protein [Mycolicibacterium palauense]|uniref:DUF4286 family protein n=1 Tax=Mycolicibacterium palauense TaxID=2034511 RepID=UPI000BFEE1E3|nr:DUF4286 family protein [Mycolicibacterium palauense]